MEEWLHCSLYLALDGAEWLVHASITVSPGKHHLYSSNWKVGGAPEPIGHFGEEKCSCPCRESNYDSEVFEKICLHIYCKIYTQLITKKK